MLRRLTRHPRSQAALAWLLAAYLALAYRTTRWTILGDHQITSLLFDPDGRPRGVIVAFWHERLSLMPMLWACAKRQAAAEGLPNIAGRQAHALISGNRDGRLLAAVMARLDLRTVVGSSSTGARAAALGLLRRLRRGDIIVITPDGPRGPRREAAPGVAELAALAGVLVIPTAASSSHIRQFRSWDRMLLPLPFGRGVLVVGKPIRVTRDGAAAALPVVEAALTAACEAADAWVAARGWATA